MCFHVRVMSYLTVPYVLRSRRGGGCSLAQRSSRHNGLKRSFKVAGKAGGICSLRTTNSVYIRTVRPVPPSPLFLLSFLCFTSL